MIGDLQAGRSAGGYGSPFPHHHERRTDADEVGKDAKSSWKSALVMPMALRRRSLLDAVASTDVSDTNLSASDPRHSDAVSSVSVASGAITQPSTSHVMCGLFRTDRKRRYAVRASDSRWQ